MKHFEVKRAAAPLHRAGGFFLGSRQAGSAGGSPHANRVGPATGVRCCGGEARQWS
jgi:hypothetical protein